ncbi:MAG: TonB-dependent receptor [Ignavibacteriaceae bacterium]|nr:TonB-dependent receptor [Ignavibacteriaceae bacterium]
MKFLFKCAVIILLMQAAVLSQSNGILTGKVVDAETGEIIIGANVLLENTTLGAATDLEGKYYIKAIPAGTYSVIFSYITHTTQKITGVVISSNLTKQLDIALKQNIIEVEEVIVQANASSAYESALLNQQKKSSSISDGISAEQIKRAPDATSGDALKRVTGVTINENKFVFVRGTSERYSVALLNNATLPSTEPDKKTFAFDLLPANVLENTIITKSFTPDSPGDFSGGLVKVNTIDFPSKMTINLSYSTSYSGNANLSDFSKYSGGKTDFLGIDDGSRSLPSSFPAKFNSSFKPDEVVNYAKTLSNNWKTESVKAPLNQSFLFSIGDGTSLIGQQFGFIAALSYKSSYQNTDMNRNEYEASGEKRFEYDGRQSTYSVLWGGLLNLSYKISDLHKISFKNTYSRTADDETTFLKGFQYSDAGSEQEQTAFRYVEREVYSGQLSGEHQLRDFFDSKLQWRYNHSSILRNEPDYKRVIYGREMGSKDPMNVVLGFQANLKNGGRFFSYLKEFSNSGGTDYTLPLGQFKIKTGLNYDYRFRSFNSRLIGVIVNAPGNGYTDFSLYTLPIDEIFAPENFRKNGLSIDEYRNGTNNYNANQTTSAAYLMTEFPVYLLGNELKIVGGFRFESSDQRVSTMDIAETNPLFVNLKKNDVLPSLNLTYRLSEVTNIRFAYSNTVNRPELRELAPFIYYDFATQTSLRGNDKLKRALIKNFDVRFESYPGFGEFLSASLFYKDMTDAIEQVVISGGALGSERTFMNANKAINYGIEIEARTSLRYITDLLSNFSINANYTRVKSEVTIFETETTLPRSGRPLQGQSPYSINTGISYQNKETGTNINLLYNKIGERIIEVANAYEEDIIEKPRDLIDFSFTQTILKDIDLKFTAKDILGKEQVFYQGDKIARKNSKVSSYSLGFSVKF